MGWMSKLSLRVKVLVLVLFPTIMLTAVLAVSATSVARERLRDLEEAADPSYREELITTLRSSSGATAVFMAVSSTTMILLCAAYTWRSSRRIAEAVEGLQQAAARLSAGELATPVRIEGSDEFAELAQDLEHMRCELVRSLELLSQKAALERDLALSAEFQARFLPRDSEVAEEAFALAAHYEPAARCGGDFWYLDRTADGKQLVMVGDVTGHGPAPALVTSAVATAVRCAQHTGQADDVEALLHSLSEVVQESGGGQFLMTLSVLRLDAENGAFEWWSTGGPPLMKCAREQKTSFVQPPGSPLGAAPLKIGFERGTLGVGERLLLVTDGILEAEQPSGRPVGVRRLRRWFEEGCSKPLVRARAHIHQQLRDTCAERPVDDDVTFVLLERLEPTELLRSA